MISQSPRSAGRYEIFIEKLVVNHLVNGRNLFATGIFTSSSAPEIPVGAAYRHAINLERPAGISAVKNLIDALGIDARAFVGTDEMRVRKLCIAEYYWKTITSNNGDRKFFAVKFSPYPDETYLDAVARADITIENLARSRQSRQSPTETTESLANRFARMAAANEFVEEPTKPLADRFSFLDYNYGDET